MRLVDMRGQIFGRLLVLERSGISENNGEIIWECRCSCKSIIYISGSKLRKGRVSDCGCSKDPSHKEYWENIRNRLEMYCCRNGQCREWVGYRDREGYGKICVNKKGQRETISCHTASWIVHNGEIPEGLSVHHKCRNNSCFNVDHLFLDGATNTVSPLSKNRRGSNHYKRKINEKDVKEIFKMKGSMSSKNVAKIYDIKASTVRSIWQRKNWKHVMEDSSIN